MKLFVLFMLICFGAGVMLQKRDYKTNLIVMFGLALLISFGYFFLNQV